MALILHIDTAQEEATVALSHNDQILQVLHNADQKQHASFIQPAIQQIMQHSTFNIQTLTAVSIIAGPGSYTGLRVGLASAKGLCYALNIPLITLNTLEVMAMAAINVSTHQHINASTLFCPMIDARRDEVFTALYDHKLNSILKPCAMILNEQSFMEIKKSHELVFLGSGAAKWNVICTNNNKVDISATNIAEVQVLLAHHYFKHKIFADVTYAEPFYIKDFYTHVQKKSN